MQWIANYDSLRALWGEIIIKNIEDEKWKPVDGFKYYQVSSLGRCRSLLRVDRLGREVGGRILKPRFNKRGYVSYNLSENGNVVNREVHRLVAIAFGCNGEGDRINHINCKQYDNRIENLEWCTAKENTRHAKKHNLLHHGNKHPGRKIRLSHARAIRDMFKLGETRKFIKSCFDISNAQVCRIIRNELWVEK